MTTHKPDIPRTGQCSLKRNAVWTMRMIMMTRQQSCALGPTGRNVILYGPALRWIKKATVAKSQSSAGMANESVCLLAFAGLLGEIPTRDKHVAGKLPRLTRSNAVPAIPNLKCCASILVASLLWRQS